MSGLNDVVETFERWLYLPDPRALYAVMAAAAANGLEGDPVWLVLVGPPGSGKSELLQSLAGLPHVHSAATITEAALLSGTPKRDRDARSKGGLLREIGSYGLLLAKDLTSVLSMHSDTRAGLLAALREVYDGSWTRHVGTDGGRTLHWEGKVGLIGGVTETIDRHHGVMSTMGERFILYRLPKVDSAEQARRSFAHAGREKEMRAELAAATSSLLGCGLPAKPKPLDEQEQALLVDLTTLVVRCRSAVERDGRTREIELIPAPEAPTRLIVVLARLLAGLDAIGLDREQAWSVVIKVGLDSIPALRREIIQGLAGAPSDHTFATSEIAARLGYPKTTGKRALEDLAAHKLVHCYPQGERRETLWGLTDWTRKRLEQVRSAEPEKSAHADNGTGPEKSAVTSLFSCKTLNDFSGSDGVAV
jgi:energy-coupling factor transporter ATP-binding protein EcfA2